MFTLIPTAVVKLMSKKKIASLGLSENSENENENELISSSDEENDGPNKRKRHPRFPRWKSGNLENSKVGNKSNKSIAFGNKSNKTLNLTVDVNRNHFEDLDEEDDGLEMAVLHTPRASGSQDSKMLLPNASDILGDGDSSARGSTTTIGGSFIRVQSNPQATYANVSNNNNNQAPPPQTNVNDPGSARTASFVVSELPRLVKKTQTLSMSGLALAVGETSPRPKDSHSVHVSSNEGDNEEEEFIERQSTFQEFKRRFSAKLQSVKSSFGPNYKKLINSGNHEEKANEKERRPSRLDVSSLRAVTWKLHFSYLIAIGSIIAALCISYFLTRALLGNLVKIASDLRNSDFRTQYGQVLALDIATLTIYEYGSITARTAADNAQRDFDGLWDIYNNVSPMRYQMDYLYTPECLLIDESKCPSPGAPYYSEQSYGFGNLFFELFDNYKKNNVTMSFDDPLYIKFRTLGETTFDGMEYLTFTVYLDAIQKIAVAKKFVAIISAVECIVFALIYMTLFRPFVKQLREENDHTFSIIRMIPKQLLGDVPEIHEFIQDTLETEKDY